jgi:hypothetical protein
LTMPPLLQSWCLTTRIANREVRGRQDVRVALAERMTVVLNGRNRHFIGIWTVSGISTASKQVSHIGIQDRIRKVNQGIRHYLERRGKHRSQGQVDEGRLGGEPVDRRDYWVPQLAAVCDIGGGEEQVTTR